MRDFFIPFLILNACYFLYAVLKLYFIGVNDALIVALTSALISIILTGVGLLASDKYEVFVWDFCAGSVIGTTLVTVAGLMCA